VALRLSRIQKLLGVRFESHDVRSLLEPLGLVIKDKEEGGDGERLLVEVPGYRSHDISREVDLIEEVARTHGYEAFSDALGAFRPGSVPDHPLFALEARVRAEMVASGLLEAQVPAFAAEGGGEVEILNPVSTEEAFLRDRLLPGLASRLQYNLRRGNRDVRLFELGTVFRKRGTEALPMEETRVAAVLCGRRAPPHWTKGSAQGFLLDSWDLKGLLERLTTVVSGDSWSVDPWDGDGEDTAGFDPSAMFRVVDGEGHERGVGGRVEQKWLDVPTWAGDVWGLELTLPAEPDSPTVPAYRSLLVHQGTDRDLALLVPAGTPVASVLSLIREHGGEDLREVEVFDVYRGPELPGDVRSVAVRLRFQAEDRTLKDEEVEGAVRAVTRTLEEELRVGIRGSQA